MYVEKRKLAPEILTVESPYRLPEPVTNGVVAGARYSPIHEMLDEWKVEVWPLPTRGTRTDLAKRA